MIQFHKKLKKYLKMKNLKIIIFCSTIFFISAGFVSNYFEITKNLEIFNNVLREINTYYVDEINPGSLMEKAIDEMLEELDPYTKYIPESEIEDFRFQTTGEYGGIGSLITQMDEYIWIAEPYYGFPADKAGLKMGYKLLEIDGQSIKNYNTEDVSDLLKGTPGTEVVLLAETTSREVKEFKIIREKIHIPSVPYSGLIDNSIGYVKLRSFTRNCAREVADSIAVLKKKNNINGLILDLRFNPGGLLNESIKLANLFIPNNEVVVTTKGKIKEWEKVYKTKTDPLYPDIPIVVLINEASASASEIIAGTLQDLDRGVVVGQRSFGKGLVQQSRKLNYNSQLKVTVAKYYTPSGRCIQSRNYSDRDNTGVVQELEDSLRKSFVTRNGRLVYDGGGVDPDIKIENQKYPELIRNLRINKYFFKFGNSYIDRVLKPDSVSKFKITDLLYNDFVSYIDSNNFSFQVKSEDILSELERTLSEEMYLENMQEQLSSIQEKILASKAEDVFRYGEDIRKELALDFTTRLFYKSGRIEYSLAHDKYVKKALELLNDTVSYQAILLPQTNN